MKIVWIFLVSAISASFPPQITFSGTVRDFSASHPNFESPLTWCREQPGLFLPQLSNVDSSPVSVPPELRTDTSLGLYRSCDANAEMDLTRWALSDFGQAYFQEYYADVPGVNIPLQINITLDLIDETLGIYQYSSTSFFPINNRGYIREQLDSSSYTMTTDPSKLTSNYWFTTQIRIPFYYKGNEQFQFVGDDDLWVFIDGKLTSCDLGGIHDARPCSINLQLMNLTVNATHEMLIFHAERHFIGSNFEVTTSIVPVNTPPVANNMTLEMNENSTLTFTLDGYDPDYNPNLKFLVLNSPSVGFLQVPSTGWFPTDQSLTYVPPKYFSGVVDFNFIMTDNMANSTVATVQIQVDHINLPPVPMDMVLQILANDTASIQLIANDADTPQADLRYNLATNPTLGIAQLNNITGVLTYTAFSVIGNDVLTWQVSDGSGFYSATLTVAVVDTLPQQKPNGENPDETNETMSPSLIAALSIGGFIALLLLSALLSYFVYTHIAAAKFQATWEKEFYQTQMVQNPLYKTATIETSNPLYRSSAERLGTVS